MAQLLDPLELLGLGFPGIPELAPALNCERRLGGRSGSRSCGHEQQGSPLLLPHHHSTAFSSDWG